MRLEVEIKGEKFTYSYVVGDSSFSSSSPFTADCLVEFAALLGRCHRASQNKNAVAERKFDSEMWIKLNLAEAQDIINNENRKMAEANK